MTWKSYLLQPGWTALGLACDKGASGELVQILINHGANIDAPVGPYARTPVDIAAARRRGEIVDLLLRHQLSQAYLEQTAGINTCHKMPGWIVDDFVDAAVISTGS